MNGRKNSIKREKLNLKNQKLNKNKKKIEFEWEKNLIKKIDDEDSLCQVPEILAWIIKRNLVKYFWILNLKFFNFVLR